MPSAAPPSLLLLPLLILLLLAPQCSSSQQLARKLVLVPTPPTILSYHNGPLLTHPISLYFLWYGSFTPAQKSLLSDFASSLSSASPSHPSVSSWWSTASSYTDLSHTHVTSSLSLAYQVSLPSPSPPTQLKKTDLLALLLSSLSSKSLPVDSKGIYFIFTADDVPVEDFCMNSCGFHSSTPPSAATQNQKLTYAWVGNPGTQCPGYCAWPYALPQFGPQTPPLVSPNKDVGMEGMVINMATVLAGAATNPYNTGFYQGDAGAPLEAASACTGAFGKGSYPGYPGSLFTDKKSGASYNAHGVNGRLFLLPALWTPATQVCTPLS
ncbi:hypothetical protein GOP47_0021294 [Adiantum capillus-veneris]|uniref:Protein EXORDIUM-like n=1 Tax=Adiantum capillus-veneris TaxID=13818 RepID=A0A9D4UAU2_ADICA|nr:hypothetical protein GOP47_0021294 [Adiantum capillus-veneris]